ncbi:MAG: Asp-tRNA(Asn)/Glu-tRNA(Gln) amidotransferase subunit GatB [Elusimicrobiota bacterium]|jgi:aspartyl-tRNA(Asn)/glutamyl-tRNA(Gln) amidotransferase subunit B|nr:Asp-tRNA(Asn)/Glu-tRNA(Gln) amidotransferase subunit GatB [Elusimicrobiota bacterium]
MKNEFESVIGLEIHTQLSTESKMFCACPNAAAELAPNTAICPLCSGQPGVLPVINSRAVALATIAGRALNARVNEVSVFARKNYFYPDLPKGYQITQDDKPIIEDGFIEIQNKDGEKKKIKIIRAHLEEDAGKSMHGGDSSLIDFNRAGVPLLEIVSAPDIRSGDEAYQYLTALKCLLQWFNISSADMEKGELRVDVNLSLMPKGSTVFGTRTEIKNLNSFKAVKDGINYEISRQAEVLSSGGKINQETRLWNEAEGKTLVMRVKETAQEYRYFPEPDLPPLKLTPAYIKEIQATMPLGPAEKRQEYMEKYQFSAYDAGVMTLSRDISNFFEQTLVETKKPTQAKAIANWIGTDILGKLNAENKEITQSPLKPSDLAALLGFIESGKISGKMAKEIFAKAWASGKTINELVEASGGGQISDASQLEAWATEAIAENQKAALDVKAGNLKAIGALVGNVMKKSKGKANPALLNEILMKLLEK